MDAPADFPTTLQAAVLYFSDPDNALATAIRFRWPDGVITCPHCGSTEHGFISTRRIWKCKARDCRKQFSVKVGTIFEDSPLGLDTWFVALWMLVNSKNGASSWELSRAVGITQKSAWFVFHRLRVALQLEDEPVMGGTVEVDETFVGGKSANMHKRKRERVVTGRGGLGSGKAVVMGLLERHDRTDTRASRARAKVIADTRRETLQPEIRTGVTPGSEVMTDGHGGYRGIDDAYVHQVIDHLEKYVEGHVHTNGIENFWSLLKRCLNGTWVSVDDAHLGRYLDEQVVRFNARKINDSGRFMAALPGVAGKRLTYKELIARPEGSPPRRGG